MSQVAAHLQTKRCSRFSFDLSHHAAGHSGSMVPSMPALPAAWPPASAPDGSFVGLASPSGPLDVEMLDGLPDDGLFDGLLADEMLPALVGAQLFSTRVKPAPFVVYECGCEGICHFHDDSFWCTPYSCAPDWMP